MNMNIKKVGVLGCGLMGSGIAQVSATAGFDVTVLEVEQKYLDMFALLSSNPPSHRMEKLPGWLARRQRSLRPATQVLDELPSGPIGAVA